jgi:hypothetical protein
VLQRKFRTCFRYKTDSGAKSLILKGLLRQHFSRFDRQALDFAGLPSHPRRAINKVIHINLGAPAKGFRIKDLSALPKLSLNFSG